MGNRISYLVMAGLLAGAVGCSLAKPQVKTVIPPVGTICDEEACVRVRPKQHIPGMEWVYQSPLMEVEEARYFPQSDRVIIYVADTHLPSYQQQVLKIMDEFNSHGFNGLIGLEGLTGNLSEDPEKIKDQREQVVRLWREAAVRSNRYAFITGDPILSPEFPASQLDYCEEPVLPRTPGMVYASPLVDSFRGRAVVVGVDDERVYHNGTIAFIKQQLKENLDLAECFYKLQTDEFSTCSAFLDQSYLPPEKRKLEFTERYRQIRDQKELLQEMVKGMRQSYACLEHSFAGNLNAQEEDHLKHLRSGIGLSNLLAAMDLYNTERGILIFGSGHQEDILSELANRNISYIHIKAAEEKRLGHP